MEVIELLNDVTVSVIIPVFNQSQYLDECISSVLNQTYRDLDIVVIDDGSTDNSFKIINKHAVNDRRVRCFRQSNSGVGAARNHGIREARGKYIYFLDGDDYLPEDIIQILIGIAEENKSELVFCGYEMVDDSGNKLSEIIPGSYEQWHHEEWAYRISATCCRLYNRKFLINSQISFTEEKNVRGEDVPFVLKSNCMAHNVRACSCVGYYYRQHSESAMHNFAGLREYKLPYNAIAEVYQFSEDNELTNSRYFLCWGILKFLAQCKFVLARGADRNTINELNNFIKGLIGQNKAIFKNALHYIAKQHIDIPFYYKVAIHLLLITA